MEQIAFNLASRPFEGMRTFTVKKKTDSTNLKKTVEGTIFSTGICVTAAIRPSVMGVVSVWDTINDFLLNYLKNHPYDITILIFGDGEQHVFNPNEDCIESTEDIEEDIENIIHSVMRGEYSDIMKKIKELDADLVKLPEKDIEKLIEEVIASVGSKIKRFKDEEEHKHHVEDDEEHHVNDKKHDDKKHDKKDDHGGNKGKK